MNCLKKAICFLALPAVLLSCMPESVQAVTVIQKSEHTVPEEHGESIFENENTLSVTCNSNRVVYNSDTLRYSIYAEDTFDYCAVRSDGIERCRDEHSAIYLFMVSDKEVSFYEVRDGLYANGHNQSRTDFQAHKTKGCDGKDYYIYLTDLTTATNKFWYGAPEAPEVRPLYMPPVITVPTDVTTEPDLEKRVLDYLITGDFADCHVSAGDSDNPSINKPGGIPGSESNPEYDENIGSPLVSVRDDAPGTGGNINGNNLEYYDCIMWKKKTSTGFNLLDSGHAVCRMQFKIEPEATFVEGGKSTVLEAETTDFSLGFCNASQLEKKFQYHNLVSRFYGKYMAEHHPATNAQSYELNTVFNYYCRVVVSDSLTVIPTQSTGWKCGKWKRVVISGNYQAKDKVSDSGDFDENGNWVSDGDYENVDDGQTRTDNPAEATSDDIDSGTDYVVGDVKSLLSQVGQFPKIITKLFSFLPKWALSLAGFAFACMIVILVIKAVRG